MSRSFPPVSLIGAPTDIGAGDLGARLGPEALRIAGLPQATIDAINQVTQLGISKGTTSTTVSPNDVVTRWQMALFLRRLAGLARLAGGVHDEQAQVQAHLRRRQPDALGRAH